MWALIGFSAGSTSQTIDVLIVDDEGLPVTGLVAATLPPITYSRAGANADATITPVDLALITTVWTSGGFKERGAGRYRLDIPNAALATAGRITIRSEDTDKRLIVELIDVGPTPQTLSDQVAAIRMKKNTALAGWQLVMFDATTGDPAIGKTVSGAVSKDGAAFGALTNSVTEMTLGAYTVDLAAGDTNGNTLLFKFVASGCKTLFVKVVTQP